MLEDELDMLEKQVAVVQSNLNRMDATMKKTGTTAL